jgi:hypothetical protein
MSTPEPKTPASDVPADAAPDSVAVQVERPKLVEVGGRQGLDPTRYGDWEKNGRCIDF